MYISKLSPNMLTAVERFTACGVWPGTHISLTHSPPTSALHVIASHHHTTPALTVPTAQRYLVCATSYDKQQSAAGIVIAYYSSFRTLPGTRPCSAAARPTSASLLHCFRSLVALCMSLRVALAVSSNIIVPFACPWKRRDRTTHHELWSLRTITRVATHTKQLVRLTSS